MTSWDQCYRYYSQCNYAQKKSFPIVPELLSGRENGRWQIYIDVPLPVYGYVDHY